MSVSEFLDVLGFLGGLIGLFLVALIPAMLAARKRMKKVAKFRSFLTKNNFKADYESDTCLIAIEKETKRIAIGDGDCYKIFEPSDIKSWGTGCDQTRGLDKKYYDKYYITLRVNSLDNPNPKAWFGGDNQERDMWHARITNLLNG